MQLTGILISWNDDRGFGFIEPKHGGAKVFTHISALPNDGSRPTVGETLTYELGRGANGQTQATKAYRNAIGPPSAQTRNAKRAPPRTGSVLSKLIVLALLGALGAYGYKQFQQKTVGFSSETQSQSQSQPLAREPQKEPITGGAAQRFSCDGRTHCSQMTSCSEAAYFLKNCPDTKMDGNNDGIPCEQQWCISPLAK
jgi:cold shock CspA family protein